MFRIIIGLATLLGSAVAWSTVMRVLDDLRSLKSFRDLAQWPTLALAVLLFAFDGWSRVHYVAFIPNAPIDSTPPTANGLWLLLLLVTLAAGSVPICYARRSKRFKALG